MDGQWTDGRPKNITSPSPTVGGGIKTDILKYLSNCSCCMLLVSQPHLSYWLFVFKFITFTGFLWLRQQQAAEALCFQVVRPSVCPPVNTYFMWREKTFYLVDRFQ